MAAITPLDGGNIKKSRASLVGGIAVGVGVMALWTAIAYDVQSASGPVLGLGAVISALIALWIWKADL
jgi:hypothetical protein